MRIEAPHKVIGFGVYATGQFALPLLMHKIQSDRESKHERWTREKHFALTALAFIVDLGFDCQTAMLFISGNYREADMVKIAHVIGADAIPETLTNLRNKLVEKLAKLEKS